MASISHLALLFLISLFPSSTISQDPNASIPTIAQCAVQLLPLAACAPFVLGTMPSPSQSCCDNLNLVYSQQPGCLCLLLNGTALSSIPINTTLALQLPALCTLPINASACLGAQVPPRSPSSQVSFGANNTTPASTNSTVASSPKEQAAAPRPAAGFGRSASTGLKSKTGSYLAVALIMAGFLLQEDWLSNSAILSI